MDTSAQPKPNDVPLFMFRHTVCSNRSTIPREGTDFIYDEDAQKAIWINPLPGNKWSKTMYGDARVDGVDFSAIYSSQSRS